MLKDAVIRRIEIIGEAMNSIPNHLQSSTQIPWREIVAMRNIIVHEYFGVMDERIWMSSSETFQS